MLEYPFVFVFVFVCVCVCVIVCVSTLFLLATGVSRYLSTK